MEPERIRLRKLREEIIEVSKAMTELEKKRVRYCQLALEIDKIIDGDNITKFGKRH